MLKIYYFTIKSFFAQKNRQPLMTQSSNKRNILNCSALTNQIKGKADLFEEGDYAHRFKGINNRNIVCGVQRSTSDLVNIRINQNG